MLKQGIPRHEQISNWIRKRIESDHFEIDEKLPSENELSKKFDVSRVTIRRALQTLENEQLIYRCQGLGSFVKDNHQSSQSGIRLTDFVENMKKMGKEASSSVIQLKPTTVSERIASILKIEPESTVVRLDRLRLGDNQPIAFDITWLPMFYGQLIEAFDLEADTIYRILAQEYDIPTVKGCYRMEAENADTYLSKHLNIDEGRALLFMHRLSLTVGEKPIYYQKRYYRTDRMAYGLMVEQHSETKISDGEMPLKSFLPVSNDGQIESNFH